MSIGLEDYPDLLIPKLKFDLQRQKQIYQLFGDPFSKYTYFWFQPPHYFEYIEYLAVSVSCFIRPTAYPFDSHQCNLSFYAPDSPDFVRFRAAIPKQDDTIQNQNETAFIVEHHGLHFVIAVESHEPYKRDMYGYTYEIAGLVFKFERHNLGALISGYFVPTALYSLASILSFTVPKDQVAGRLGMIVTLFLISTNSYNNLDAPEDRGVSYIEIWMIGTHFPILVALIQFCAIMAAEKFFGYTKNLKKWDLHAIPLILFFHFLFQCAFWFRVSMIMQY